MAENESNKARKVRIAAIGDLHIRESDRGSWSHYFEEVSRQADVLLICGDLTDTGDEEEARILLDELKSCTIPVIGVMGNHDHEKGRHKLIREILQSKQVHILDGEAVTVRNVGFAGVKGFGGGFDNHMLALFGEEAMKAFVKEAVNEAMRLDRALTRLDAEHGVSKKIALMHYSPIAETIRGEPEQLFPFLGCSHLAEPLNRRKVLAAFHGHAHVGTLEGKTSEGVKVFNVSRPILLKAGYKVPFYIFEV